MAPGASTAASGGVASTRQSGDRGAFVARLRGRLVAGIPDNTAHPMPGPLDESPIARSAALDPDDLIGSFVANARTAAATVHDVDGHHVPDDLLADVVRRHGVGVVVVSSEPEAQALAPQLAALGVSIAPATITNCAAADLGVTAATHALATTGTVVLDSSRTGARSISLLPPAHLCVLPASRIVASTADVLRRLDEPGQELPANLVLITGPSRSGDIEQIITLGVHGPLAVEIIVLRDIAL